jgi:hypothetical protein
VFRGRLGEFSRDHLIDRTPAHFGVIVSVLIPPHANAPKMVAHRRLSLTQEMEACSLYTGSNRTLRELADRYGLSPAGVLKILIRNGVERRRQGRQQGRKARTAEK